MVIEIPNRLKQRGINFVLLEKGGKKPFQIGWQDKLIEFDNPELLSHINNGGNYGVKGGGASMLIIIDFDSIKLQDEIVPKLPKTFTVKTGTGKFHKYFFSDCTESFKIFDEEMNTLADIQGEGKQVVGAGSTHPNGNKYEVVDDSGISLIPYSEIKALLMPYDKKPKKEKKEIEKPKTNVQDEFLDKLKLTLSIEDVLNSLGVSTNTNPCSCPFHDSKGGKCLGFNRETAHCFHCDGSWNIFSLVKEFRKCDFKEALEYLSNLAGLQDELEISKRKYIDSLHQNEENIKKEILFTFLSCIKDKELGSATEIIVEYILKNNYIITSKDDEKTEMWIYKDGVYIPQGKSEVKQIMRDLLKSVYNSFYYNQVITKLEADTMQDIDSFFNNININEIPVKNGILNLFTRELKPFSPEKIFFNKLPVEYNPSAKCPQIEKFLDDVLSKEDDKDVFYELGGFCLYKEYKFEKAFMLLGDGRNGKDKTLELIKRTIGIENCCSVPLSSIVPDSFIISEFFGKMVNVAGDIDNRDLKDTGTFKGLTGRSIQTAPRKFQKPITFVNYAKFIFACNNLPMVYDTSKGFWDRWILLEFPYTFVTKKELEDATDKKMLKIRDESIIEKISTPEELSGLLNKFLDGLDKLIQFKEFSTTKGSEEIKNFWIRKSNSAMAFCLDMIEESYDSYIPKKDFRKKYSDYCKKHKVIVKSDYVIKKSLEELYGAVESNKNVLNQYDRVWEGIKWKK